VADGAGRARRPWARAEGTPDKRKRGRAGQRDRQRRLARTGGLCEHCLDEGRTTLASVVNHKIPLARGGEDVDENTENLCGPCDVAETARQFGLAQPIQGRGIGEDGRPTSPDHPWNRRL
jgi:5-methylcytosine-specific restriction protein A